MPKCKKCGRDIRFVKMESGKYMPCDLVAYSYVEMRNGDESFVTTSGKLIRGKTAERGEMPDGIALKPHWATCPAAEEVRRR